MITTKKIAELAGVSRGTVDRVLNNRGQVNEETRIKIMEIAKNLNYKPNPAGRSLVNKQKNWKVGCIIIKSDNPFYDELCKGIEKKMAEYEAYGMRTILRRVDFNAVAQCEVIDEFLKEEINALILQPADDDCLREKLLELEKKSIPVVTVNTTLPDYVPFCYIGNDFYTCGRTAANLLQLVTDGQCKVGIITGFHKAKSHYDRLLGFKDFLKDYPNMEVIETKENLDDDFISFDCAKQLLTEHSEINAMFLIAGGVYGACRALKTFPDYKRIRVISFDTVPTTRELVLDGTIFATIDQQPVRQGMMAMDVLFNKLFNNENPVCNKLYTDIEIKLKANLDHLITT